MRYGAGGGKLYRIKIGEIVYVEIQGHRLTYHLFDGQTVLGWGVLKKLAEEMKEFGFGCCNSSYLLNFKYIASLNSSAVKMMNGEEFVVTRRKKEQFLSEFSDYLGNGGV